eukprot:gnl/TRDRNA2_/TRDRNA2_93787_c2_seq3.p1 gnl/TRDRNA2_/TRDRNA2_93787_c2~~gnl/TRDRNA2_/TRDRNA2_93787_c2_seq3.p1  ORF type:complete len:661 (-),score=144.14 gnl/TRDRNA2_/TRDRNA2_93787_c2_seq3:91-1896(-)
MRRQASGAVGEERFGMETMDIIARGPSESMNIVESGVSMIRQTTGSMLHSIRVPTWLEQDSVNDSFAMGTVGLDVGSKLSRSYMEDEDLDEMVVAADSDKFLVSRSGKRRERVHLQLIGTLERKPSTRLQLIIENLKDMKTFYDVEMLAIGKGAFGAVRKGIVKTTGAQRAIKSIEKKHMKEWMDGLKKEIEITKMMDHPSIVKLYEVFEDATCIYLVMELCTGGQLRERILSAGGRFPESLAAIVMMQMLRAIYYLHKLQVVHRDLKPENVLVAQPGPISSTSLRLTDFGVSTTYSEGEMLTAQAGTLHYMAPQVLADSPRQYDQSCDMWSCGVMMYVVLSGYLPFRAKSEPEVRRRVAAGDFDFDLDCWDNISEEARDLIRMLLKVDPKTRYSAEKAQRAVWFKKNLPPKKDVVLKPSMIENLRNFRSHNKFKRAALHVIVSMLDEENIHEPREIFMNLDIDGDGMFSVEELRERLRKSPSLQRAGLLPEDVVFQNTDDPNGGTGLQDFAYTEFLAATFDRGYCDKNACWAAFNAFDQDGNGTISQEELMSGKVLGRLSQDELEKMVQDLDENGDGEIDFEEFMHMMSREPKVCPGNIA